MLNKGQTQTSSSSPQTTGSMNLSSRRGIDPMTLVTLNFGLFRSLYAMGTSREQICASMLLNSDEFDYIVGLMNGQRFRSSLGESKPLSR
jgi:hypothetical protein